MEGQGWEKNWPKKIGQRSAGKTIEYGRMLVNVGWRGRWKTQPILWTANWCSHGGWFTLAIFWGKSLGSKGIHFTHWAICEIFSFSQFEENFGNQEKEVNLVTYCSIGDMDLAWVLQSGLGDLTKWSRQTGEVDLAKRRDFSFW